MDDAAYWQKLSFEVTTPAEQLEAYQWKSKEQGRYALLNDNETPLPKEHRRLRWKEARKIWGMYGLNVERFDRPRRRSLPLFISKEKEVEEDIEEVEAIPAVARGSRRGKVGPGEEAPIKRGRGRPPGTTKAAMAERRAADRKAKEVEKSRTLDIPPTEEMEDIGLEDEGSDLEMVYTINESEEDLVPIDGLTIRSVEHRRKESATTVSSDDVIVIDDPRNCRVSRRSAPLAPFISQGGVAPVKRKGRMQLPTPPDSMERPLDFALNGAEPSTPTPKDRRVKPVKIRNLSNHVTSSFRYRCCGMAIEEEITEADRLAISTYGRQAVDITNFESETPSSDQSIEYKTTYGDYIDELEPESDPVNTPGAELKQGSFIPHMLDNSEHSVDSWWLNLDISDSYGEGRTADEVYVAARHWFPGVTTSQYHPSYLQRRIEEAEKLDKRSLWVPWLEGMAEDKARRTGPLVVATLETGLEKGFEKPLTICEVLYRAQRREMKQRLRRRLTEADNRKIRNEVRGSRRDRSQLRKIPPKSMWELRGSGRTIRSGGKA